MLIQFIWFLNESKTLFQAGVVKLLTYPVTNSENQNKSQHKNFPVYLLEQNNLIFFVQLCTVLILQP